MPKRPAHDVAEESYRFWTGAIPGVIRPYGPLQAYGFLAMQDGETSFRYPFPVGDHGHAHGPFQHQLPRIVAINHGWDAHHPGIGIDLLDPNLTNLDGLRAADWETSELGPPPYRVIRRELEALNDIGAMVALLVNKFEQSMDRERDTRLRLSEARYWAGQFGPGIQS